MFTRKWYVAPVLAMLLAASLATAKTTTILDVQKLMTPAEQKATGISSLSAAQVGALNIWLDQYSRKLLLTYKAEHHTLVSSGYAGVGSEHWIENNSDGKIITLEDGSIWEVSPIDQVDTALWLPVTNMTVLKHSGDVAGFNYVLVNHDDGEKASAKYLGSSR